MQCSDEGKTQSVVPVGLNLILSGEKISGQRSLYPLGSKYCIQGTSLDFGDDVLNLEYICPWDYIVQLNEVFINVKWYKTENNKPCLVVSTRINEDFLQKLGSDHDTILYVLKNAARVMLNAKF